IQHGMVEVNTAAAYIALPRFLRHNRPENANVAKGWVTAIATIPECPERQRLIERCREELGDAEKRRAFERGLDELFAKPFAEPFRQPSRTPEQEQEQEQEQEPEPKPEPFPEQSSTTAVKKENSRVVLPDDQFIEQLRSKYKYCDVDTELVKM